MKKQVKHISSSNISAVKLSEKLSDSSIFNENWTKLEDFLIDLRIKLFRNANQFKSLTMQLNYVITRLEDKAKDIFQLWILNNDSMIIDSLNDFVNELTKNFENSDKKKTA